MRTTPVALVVSTLGRLDALRNLIESLAPQLESSDSLIVVAQGRVDEVRELLDDRRPTIRGRVVLSTSDRGASLGRNTGVEHIAPADGDVIMMFPNDTTTFPPGSLSSIRRSLGGALAGAVAVVTPNGPRFELAPRGAQLDATTVWRVIEMGLVIRRSLFQELRGFDTEIGTGAPTPWQAGEVTDLLMRCLERRPSLAREFVWIHAPGAFVTGISETEKLSGRERRRKVRAYGRGVGYVFRRHPFPLWHRVRFAAAGLLIGVLRPREYQVADGVAAAVGRVEGLVGRTLPSRHVSAVDR